MMNRLEPGAEAPDFKLEDQDGNVVELSDFAGQKLLVYFYPRASTPGCTRQSCAVNRALPDLGRLGIAAVGISPDRPAAQKKFAGKHGLSFPLLSDADKAVAEAYGAFGEKTLYGKLTRGIIRSSFLIDENRTILGAFYKVKPEDTVQKALALLEG